MKKIYLEVYGCSSNKADYEIALGLLSGSFQIVKNEKNSDLNIIFTCSVKIPTVNKILYRIRKLTELGKPLVVGGCLPLTRKKEIERINPKASLISPDNIFEISKVVNYASKGKKIELIGERKEPKFNLPRCRINPIIGIVQIGRGCLSNCSFCVEPYKGKLFSYPINCILKEIENTLKNGCREIWLTSLDTGCYGFDMNTSLVELLERVCEIDEKFFVRVGMMNPKYLRIIGKDLLKIFENEKIFKFLHLPLQSGSNRILKLMNRDYKVEEFVKWVKKFRKKFPLLTLATDLIVGFPGEREKDFKKSLKVIERIEADIVNVSKFGVHPGTLAEKMEKVPGDIVKERSKLASELVKEISLKRNEKWKNWEGEILIDEIGKRSTFVGRNFAYKPIVVEGENIFGKFVRVRILNFKQTYLIGKLN